jgi:hypothetical protein
MTVFPLSKWAIKKIDKIRPSFLWQGNEDVRGGHCLVNWKQVQWVKKLGGLGVLDLARFNRALRLRWRRYQWRDHRKSWANMDIKLSNMEQELFRACTTITVNNGKSTSFWHDRWLRGLCPKEIASALFKLTRCKNITVAQGCSNRRWMRGFHA